MKIAIVTPLKDEKENIEKLFDSISRQHAEIYLWVIVENDSSDGSKELLRQVERPSNVKNLKVLNIEMADPAYALGHKYSTIVNTGFKYIKENHSLCDNDFIGILDADCFPEIDYYAKLTKFMNEHRRVGISSGVIVQGDGRPDIASVEWVRGGCRLWKFPCFTEAGYLIGPSADTISAVKAEMRGWKVAVCENAFVTSRETGVRAGYGYYGSSTYFRGIGPFYALFKSLYLSRKNPRYGFDFFVGYFDNFLKKKPRIQDIEVRRYFKGYGLRVILGKLRSKCKA